MLIFWARIIKVEEDSLTRILLCILWALLVGGKCRIWQLFLYRPAPPCILPVYRGVLGSLSLFFFINILFSLFIKNKKEQLAVVDADKFPYL